MTESELCAVLCFCKLQKDKCISNKSGQADRGDGVMMLALSKNDRNRIRSYYYS